MASKRGRALVFVLISGFISGRTGFLEDSTLELPVSRRQRWTFIVIGLGLLMGAVWYFRAHPATQKSKTNPDQPPTIKQLQEETKKACEEAKRRHEVLDQRFPNPDAVDNDVYFKSREYLDAASWDQACDTATADLEEASKLQ